MARPAFETCLSIGLLSARHHSRGVLSYRGHKPVHSSITNSELSKSERCQAALRPGVLNKCPEQKAVSKGLTYLSSAVPGQDLHIVTSSLEWLGGRGELQEVSCGTRGMWDWERRGSLSWRLLRLEQAVFEGFSQNGDAPRRRRSRRYVCAYMHT
jgi:hypothetical protein